MQNRGYNEMGQAAVLEYNEEAYTRQGIVNLCEIITSTPQYSIISQITLNYSHYSVILFQQKSHLKTGE